MLPVLFEVGSFKVHTWGLLLMAGFLLGVWRAAKNASRYQFEKEDVWDVSLVGLFGGILGGRLAFVLLNIREFAANPLSVFAFWEGGMTSFGGFIGGIAAGLLMCRFKKMNLWDMADLAAVSLPLGYCLGRIGCFLNGCCYGGVCELPWAVRFHLHDGALTPPSHPAQLYSAIAALIIFALLVPLERNRQFRGQIILAFGFLYGVYRFLVEFVREGATADQSGLLNLTEAQVASLVLSGLAAVAYLFLRQRAVKVGKP
ncbi:MAG: prolipoprotein diacylglyceryl transferase [Armatimonadaceae bacterium]